MFERIIPEIFVHDGFAALDFYKRAFDAEERSRSATSDGKKLLHAEILINGHRVYVCEELDASEGGICKSPRTLGASPVRFMLEVNDAEAFVAKARAAGTTVLTPVHASSWGSRYARLRDPFGHEWGINQQLR